ncbi:MAG: hypothetical protein IPJ73_14170 [Zoogloea sp.]|nr:hypothetical protein [Zoogloea sp.]
MVEARGQAQAAAAQAQQGHHHHHGQVVGAHQAGVALGRRRQGGAGEPGIHQLMQALAQQGVPGVVAGAAQPDGGCSGLGARADAGQVVEQAGRAGRVRGRAGGPQIGAAAHVAGDVGVVGGGRGDGLPQAGQGLQQGLVDGVGEGVAHLAKPAGGGGDQVVGDGGGGGLGRPCRQHGGVEQAAQVGQGGIAQIDGPLEKDVEAGLGVLAQRRGHAAAVSPARCSVGISRAALNTGR